MLDTSQQYQDKLTTKQDLVNRFREGDSLSLGVWYGEPWGVIGAIGEHCTEIPNLHIASGIATCPSPYMQQPNKRVWTAFFGPQERAARATHDNVLYTPLNYCDGPRLMEYGRPIDYYIYRVGPMNEHGNFNCSLTASWEFRALPWLKKNRPDTTIVFEVNPNLPYVHGLEEFGGNELPIDLPDIIVEDDSPLLEYPVPPPNDIEEAIARNVANLVRDRDTVQLGFGTLPMAIGHLLRERTELGVHTEMFCEAHIELIEEGAVSNAHKGLHDGISVATFALGTKRLHDWMADNPEVAIIPVEEVNRANVLARLNNLTSVNSVLSVDMTGQTLAHCLGPETYSGLGGAFEFAFGAQLSPGGQSIVCLPSTTTLSDGTVVSNIVAQHPAGTRITTPEHITEWVVTEHGAVRLKFLAYEERAKAMLSIAHPDFREPLEKEMRAAGINFDKLRDVPALPPNSHFGAV